MDRLKNKLSSLKNVIKEKVFTLKSSKIEPKPEESSDPKRIYKNFLVPFLKKELSLLGYKIFDPNYKISFLFGLVIFDDISYFLLNGINIWLIRDSDFETICFFLTTWFFGVTGLMLVHVGFKNKILLCDLLKIIYDFGDNLDKETESEEIEKYVKHSEDCKKLYIISTIIFSGGGFIFTLYPIVVYYLTGDTILPFAFFIPGISKTENPGYIINFLYQSVQTYCTVLGTIQTTFHSFLLLISNSFFQIDNLIIKLRKLSRAIEANPNINGYESQLEEIIKLHQELKSYLSTVDELYSLLFFVNIGCYTAMNIIILFVLLNQHWFIGYYLLVVLLGLIFLPCAIGTVLEMKNDALLMEIYEVPWYLLTPKERRTFLLFLCGAQATAMPSCGGFVPLNVDTFRKTYSKIYSFLMFLLDTHKK